MARVRFTTSDGEVVSFTTRKRGGGARRRPCRGCGGKPPVLFRKGDMLPRPRGLSIGQIVRVTGKSGLYMVMKDGLKPVKMN